jgi:hypothetical protein
MGAAAREGRQAARDAVPSQLNEYLVTYLDGAGLRRDPKGPLFRTIGRGTGAPLKKHNSCLVRFRGIEVKSLSDCS